MRRARILVPTTADLFLRGGQTVCRGGTQRPCYKIVYFHDASRRISFAEADQACRRDGGHLVSIESEAEQKLIEKFIEGLLASDGDFWIGLRRKGEDLDNSTDCQDLYAWSDGSSSGFRNWYEDEPSCGSEICVVMYHQPSAPPGVGGPYMFQWNDDRCNMKNNFICKYSLEKPTSAPEEDFHEGSLKPTSPEELIEEEAHVKDVVIGSLKPTSPGEPIKEEANVTLKEAKEPVLSLAYILIPSIPLLLLLMVVTAIFCFWLFAKRRQDRVDASPKEQDVWLSPQRPNSPNLEIYSVIKKQTEADLAGTRPDTKISSFRSPGDNMLDNLSGDYENVAVNTSESGFVTLASTESGFVTNEIYELCSDRVGRSKESTWVENEIYDSPFCQGAVLGYMKTVRGRSSQHERAYKTREFRGVSKHMEELQGTPSPERWCEGACQESARSHPRLEFASKSSPNHIGICA
ncbi:layilin isoform B [Alligator mississippiensis]|uniref:Layilin isoform B n=1 Tax=Alligator mississippiensis TaxID=8496 RepID=A0A151NFZ9_ALLMI|nr:layilin isoform B [Alligator mississippiensis]